MQLNVTGHHIDVTDSLRNYVEEKFQRIERHFDQVTQVHVVLTVEKMEQRAEATVSAAGAQLFANASSGDMYASIDSMAHKLDRQIRRHKEKVTDHHRAEGGLKNHDLAAE